MTTTISENQLIIDEPEAQRFRVHSNAYTSPEIFAAEMDNIFEASWVYLAHESQLPESNDYLSLRIGSQPVILTRGSDGELRGLLNRCRHRGALVCRESRGNSAHFRCMYHGWSYKNTGELVGVADREGYPPSFDFDNLNLQPIAKLSSYKGFIFGSLNGDVPELDVHLGNAKHYLDLIVDKFRGGIRLARGTVKYGYQGNWKLQIENSLDVYHPPFVHKSFVTLAKERGRVTAPSLNKNLAQVASEDHAVYLGRGHGVTIKHKDPTKTTSPLDALRMPSQDLARRFGEEGASVIEQINVHLLIYPNLMILEDPSPQVRTVRPRSIDESEVEVHAYYPAEASVQQRDELLRDFEDFFGPSGLATPDDIEVFRACTQGFGAKGAPWLDLSRGLHREKTDIDAAVLSEFESAGSPTDDTIYRGLFRWWAELVAAGTVKG